MWTGPNDAPVSTKEERVAALAAVTVRTVVGVQFECSILCQLTTPAGVDFLRLTASEYRQAIYTRKIGFISIYAIRVVHSSLTYYPLIKKWSCNYAT